MQERTTGAFSILSRPGAYSLLQRLLDGSKSLSLFVQDHLRPQPGDRILDIGCGTGEILDHLPEVEYVGIDINRRYIEAARERYGDRGEFHQIDVRDAQFPSGSFNIVSAVALLHHLDDEGAASVFELGSGVITDSGRMGTVDPTFTHDQDRLARWVISKDRGACVRGPQDYADLAQPFFDRVEVVVREDMLRVPYTHAILECESPRRREPSAG